MLGPTACGKSGFALHLADRLPFEIISMDSAQVYRGLDIGTAKPDAVERARATHHLLDIAEPHEAYSAGRFRRDALMAMDAIAGRACAPLVVGGTNLYFRALRDGLAPLPTADPAVRACLDACGDTHGWPRLHAWLAAVDAPAAARIRPHDRQRLQRALEVFALTGQPLSRQQARRPQPLDWTLLVIALVPQDRDALRIRIRERFELMMERGLLDEVHSLTRRTGPGVDLPALRAVGYRQLARHIAGELTLEAAVEAAVAATRRLAKRQLTWLRSEVVDLVVDPFDGDALRQCEQAVERFLAAGEAGPL